MTDIDRAVARLFVPREHGFDYYPFGFDKPGYGVDRELLDEAVRIERGGSQRALAGVGSVALLLYFVLPNIAMAHPSLVPIANSAIIRIAIAIPLLALIYALVMLRRRRLLAILLLDRKARSEPLSAAEALAHRAQSWRMTPLYSRVAMFVLVPLAALAMALFAGQRLPQQDALAQWEGSLAVLYAIGLIALYGFLIYRVMAFRAEKPKNPE
jgi:hypothetical protein